MLRTELSDQEIIRNVLNGDRRAYAVLVERHSPKAMALALRMLKDRHDAEEALQDAFVRAFRALSGFEQRSSFSTWLYRIVFNVCSSRLGRHSEPPAVSLDLPREEGPMPEIAADDALPDAEFEQEEFSAIVRSEIAAMDPHYAAILTMFFLQELSYEEIMEVTGLPLGTVKNRLFRARMQLRSAVLNHFKDQRPAVIS